MKRKHHGLGHLDEHLAAELFNVKGAKTSSPRIRVPILAHEVTLFIVSYIGLISGILDDLVGIIFAYIFIIHGK